MNIWIVLLKNTTSFPHLKKNLHFSFSIQNLQYDRFWRQNFFQFFSQKWTSRPVQICYVQPTKVSTFNNMPVYCSFCSLRHRKSVIINSFKNRKLMFLSILRLIFDLSVWGQKFRFYSLLWTFIIETKTLFKFNIFVWLHFSLILKTFCFSFKHRSWGWQANFHRPAMVVYFHLVTYDFSILDITKCSITINSTLFYSIKPNFWAGADAINISGLLV